MNILLLWLGKSKDPFIDNLIGDYIKRTGFFVKTEVNILPDSKENAGSDLSRIKKNEAALFLKKLNPSDYVILLDEKGKNFNSVDFSKNIEQKMNSGIKRLVFIIGGAYGFDQTMYDQCNEKLALSLMTFPHDLAKLFLAEQLYRAMTLIRNIPYHN